MDEDKATSFESYLSQVFNAPKAYPTSIFDDQILNYLDSACPMSLPIHPFSHTEILAEITRISPRKAPGFDLLTGRILKELPKEATTLLTIIYNSMLRLTYFPITWKFAQVIMIPKPGKPQRINPTSPIRFPDETLDHVTMPTNSTRDPQMPRREETMHSRLSRHPTGL
jgi:hypothetical protein